MEKCVMEGTGSGRLTLRYNDVESERYAICFIHGSGEHSGRYEKAAEIWAGKGVSFYAYDLPGHGTSDGRRGHTWPRENMIGDIDRVIGKMTGNGRNDRKIFICGYSLGGNIALDHRRYGIYRNRVQGYVFVAPWVVLARKISRPYYFLMKLVAHITPGKWIDTGTGGKNSPDILMHSRITAGAALDSFRSAGEFCSNTGRVKISESRVPALVVHGDEDMMCNVEGSRILKKNMGDVCTYVEIHGMDHGIHRYERKIAEITDEWAEKITAG